MEIITIQEQMYNTYSDLQGIIINEMDKFYKTLTELQSSSTQTKRMVVHRVGCVLGSE